MGSAIFQCCILMTRTSCQVKQAQLRSVIVSHDFKDIDGPGKWKAWPRSGPIVEGTQWFPNTRKREEIYQG